MEVKFRNCKLSKEELEEIEEGLVKDLVEELTKMMIRFI